MSRRVKIMMVGVALVLALTLGLTAVAFASEPDENGKAECEKPWEAYVGKVADRLGIDEDELIDACRGAGLEMREQAIERFLERAVEKGCIDEQESADIQEWWDDRPAAVDELGECIRPHFRAKCRVHHRLMGPALWHGHGFRE